jgi:hypoxanthine phosphoribosyltransferase
VKVVALLFKREAYQAESVPDYIGFEIPRDFVVGYGMDYNEEYRNLPFVGRLGSGSQPDSNS